MRKIELRNDLIASLAQMYEMEAFKELAVFLQGEIQVLLYLIQNADKEVNPSALSEKLYVSRSRITATLTSLRKKGYVEMEMSEGDRRRMRVTLTPKGAAFIRDKQAQVERYFDVMVEGLGEGNVAELNRIIDLSMKIMGAKELV